MKTDEEIREEALKTFPIDNLTPSSEFVSDANGVRRKYWLKGYKSCQTSMESEIQRRVEEAVKEYKEGLLIGIQKAAELSYAHGTPGQERTAVRAFYYLILELLTQNP